MESNCGVYSATAPSNNCVLTVTRWRQAKEFATKRRSRFLSSSMEGEEAEKKHLGEKFKLAHCRNKPFFLS